jgi:hypothetical protein
MKRPASILRCRSGSAATEMALVTPLLLTLLFGSMEMGKYFLDQHVVVKAVRDGARFAARQQMENYMTADAGCLDIASGTVATATQNVVRSGNPSGTGSRLSYWTDPATITVSSECSVDAGEEDVRGIYLDSPAGAPVITVSATVPYTALLDFNPFTVGLELRAEQQAIVTGI